MLSSLHLMAHFQQVSILKTCIILFSPLLQSPEYETSKALEEFSEKELTNLILYDISDDCSVKSRKNYTLNHLIERIKIYNEENFNYDIITIQLKDK